jgi:hypothetical protein
MAMAFPCSDVVGSAVGLWGSSKGLSLAARIVLLFGAVAALNLWLFSSLKETLHKQEKKA